MPPPGNPDIERKVGLMVGENSCVKCGATKISAPRSCLFHLINGKLLLTRYLLHNLKPETFQI